MKGARMRPRKFIPPTSILLFLALTLAGTYVVRKGLHERAMSNALAAGDEGMIERLAYSWPCPVKARDNRIGTPLHWAAREGRLDLAQRFLAKGADVNAKGAGGPTPMHVGVWVGPGGPPPDWGVTRVYGDSGAAGGWTPLLWASAKGRKEIVELLIAKGADVNATTADLRWTPLHWAAEEGYKEIAEVLIARGAKVHAKAGNDGGTPLHWAVDQGHNEIAELLIARGADVNGKGGGGTTPLHWAVWQGRERAAGLLIDRGADVNAKDDNAWTPLHWAAGFERKGAAELLIAKGADLAAKEMSGKTALKVAVEQSHDAVAGVLRKAGATE